MRWAAVIAAAGRGTRFQRPKQLFEVAGAPLVSWSMKTFAQISEIAEIVIVTERESIPAMQAIAGSIFSIPVRVVQGGETRQESVGYGLAALSQESAAVLVHDGARPLVQAGDVRAGMSEVRDGRAAVLAAHCIDTIKVVDRQTRIVQQTLDRTTLWAAQTPQFAMVHDVRSAHARAYVNNFVGTDEAALLELIGVEVAVVPSTSPNIKVTRPEDLIIVEALLKRANA